MTVWTIDDMTCNAIKTFTCSGCYLGAVNPGPERGTIKPRDFNHTFPATHTAPQPHVTPPLALALANRPPLLSVRGEVVGGAVHPWGAGPGA